MILYDFWGDEITKSINNDKNSDYLINLASVEYFKSINTDKFKIKINKYNSFKEKRRWKIQNYRYYTQKRLEV